MSSAEAPTPYELLGGEAAVRALTERFYDLMDTSPDAVELRAMHGPDLALMREKLYDFMSGWLGGPPRYFERTDRQCMTSVHAQYAIGARERDQWLACMNEALATLDAPAATVELVRAALTRVADALRNA